MKCLHVLLSRVSRVGGRAEGESRAQLSGLAKVPTAALLISQQSHQEYHSPLTLSCHCSLTCASYSSFVSSSFSSSFLFSFSSSGHGEWRRSWSQSRMLYPVGAASAAGSCGEQIAQDQYT